MKAILLLVALTSTAALPASAAVMRATWSGTAQFTDATDYLGQGNSGSTDFALSYTYDTSLGERLPGSGYDGRQGGGRLGGDTPITAVSLRIGSVTMNFTPDFGRVMTGPSYRGEASGSYSDAMAGLIDFVFSLNTGAVPGGGLGATLEDGFTHLFNSLVQRGTFYLYGDDDLEVALRLLAGRVDVTEVPVVPLPAGAWGLLTGLGALAALKRRKTPARAKDSRA